MTITVHPVNADPVADAGPNQNVNEQTLVTLNGGGSSDSDGSINAYAWNQTNGMPVSLSGANTSSPTFTSPEITGGKPSVTLRFSLQVTDNE